MAYRSARLPLPDGGLLEIKYRILPDRHQAGQDFTPLAKLKDAAASVEQAHEGIGNIIKFNLDQGGVCGDRCYKAIQDARQKNLRAWHEVQSDVLDVRTWDHNQTVAHAFDAADYWLDDLEQVYNDVYSADIGKHAEYQLGILRDVLAGLVKKRSSP